jgi:hypothetical protein
MRNFCQGGQHRFAGVAYSGATEPGGADGSKRRMASTGIVKWQRPDLPELQSANRTIGHWFAYLIGWANKID